MLNKLGAALKNDNYLGWTIHFNYADSSSKCNFRINAEEYLIRRFKGETFSWSVV